MLKIQEKFRNLLIIGYKIILPKGKTKNSKLKNGSNLNKSEKNFKVGKLSQMKKCYFKVSKANSDITNCLIFFLLLKLFFFSDNNLKKLILGNIKYIFIKLIVNLSNHELFEVKNQFISKLSQCYDFLHYIKTF